VLGMLPFFVTDRYRHHLMPALALLAAVTLAELARRVRERDPRALAVPALATALASLAVFAPLRGHDPALIAFQNTFDVGTRWLDSQQPARAAAEFERGIRIEREHGFDTTADRTLVEGRAQLHFNYGITLRRLGRREGSLTWLRAAARDLPDQPRYLRALAEAEREAGSARAADSLLTRTAAVPGGRTEALFSEGWRAAREGRLDDAERAFRASVTADSRHYGAWGALVRAQVQRGEPARAAATLAEAAAAGMPPAPYHVHEALVAAARGDAAAMERALAQVPPGALAADPALARVAEGARVLVTRAKPE
jgi:tetratricopeptide (TPR) repeat protein